MWRRLEAPLRRQLPHLRQYATVAATTKAKKLKRRVKKSLEPPADDTASFPSLTPSPFCLFRSAATDTADASCGNTVSALKAHQSVLRAVECWIHPARLLQRIRSIVVQLVLLSHEPQTPHDLLEAFENVVDASTQHQYTSARCAVMAFNADAVSSPPELSNTVASVTMTPEEWKCMQDIGGRYAALYQTSILNAMRVVALVSSSSPSSSARATQDTVPPMEEVHRWMIYGILLSDPCFRISMHGGYICYPTQPSTLLASLDVARNAMFRTTCQRILAGEERDRDAAMPCSRSSPMWSRCTEALSVESGATCFVWLRTPPPRTPRWTYAHSLTYVLNGFKYGRGRTKLQDDVDLPSTTTGSRDRSSSAIASSSTSGHPLVDLWIHTMDNNAPDSLGSYRSNSILMSRNGHPLFPSQSSTAATPSPLMWNEGQRGSSMLTSWNAESTSDSEFVCYVMSNTLKHASAGEALFNVNSKVIRCLLSSIVSVPISVARLSTLIRWNVSVPWASSFRSFLYVLLLGALNPTAKLLWETEEQRQCISTDRTFAPPLSFVSAPHTPPSTSAVLPHWAEKYLSMEDQAVKLMRDGMATRSSSDVKGAERLRQRQAALNQRGRDGLKHLTTVWENIATSRTFGAIPTSATSALCFRVLPHARPGRCAALGVKEKPWKGRSDYRGLPLRYVEVLPTWRLSPEETMCYLLSLRRDEERGGEGTGSDGAEEAALWLEEEEAHLIVVPVNDSVFYQRILRVAEAWQERCAPPRKAKKVAPAVTGRFPSRMMTLTVGDLCKLTLWTHEYGAAMAAELMIVYLLQHRRSVTVTPPPTFSSAPGANTEEEEVEECGVGYSAWSVTLWKD